jgi:hypothetical protein
VPREFAQIRQPLDHEVEQCAQSRKPPEVTVIADIGVATGRRIAEIDQAQVGQSVGKRAGQHGDADALRAHPRLHVAIIASRHHMRVRQHLLEPGRIRHSAERDVHGDQRRALAVARHRRVIAVDARVDAVGDMHQPAQDDVGLVERSVAKHDVRLAARQAVEPGIGQKLHHNTRLQLGKFGHHRRQQMRAEPVRRGDTQKPVEFLVLAGKLAPQAVTSSSIRSACARTEEPSLVRTKPSMQR